MKDNKVEQGRQGALILRQQFLQSGDGAFDRVLGDEGIATVISELLNPYRERIYPPLDTLRLFVGQVLSADHACQDVVGRRLPERVAKGQSANALRTGSYCDAAAITDYSTNQARREDWRAAGVDRTLAVEVAWSDRQAIRWHHRVNARYAEQSASLSAKP